MARPFTDEDYELWWLLVYTRRIIYIARKKELTKYKITSEEAAVLWAIKSIGPKAKPASIARWLMRKPHSISGLVSRMNKHGLVKKVHDLDRKNWVRIELTEKGEKAYISSLNRESIHSIFSGLSEEDRIHLRSCLTKLSKGGVNEMGLKLKLPFTDLFAEDVES